MAKTVLLTGATGFLGSHLLHHLINSTDYNIIILKRSFSKLDKIKDVINSPRIKTFDSDLNELSKIFNIPKDSGFDNIYAIIHCATNYGRNCSCSDTLNSNLIFPIELIELAIKNNVEVFINTDSYFNKENMSYLYLQNYSLSKKSLLLWLKYFSSQIKVINVVLEHIYGECDNKEKFVTAVIKNIAIDKVSEFNCTHGSQKRDFVYVKDVCRAYEKLLEYSFNHKFKFRSFNIGTGIATSIKDFVLKVKEVSNSPTTINFGKIPYREDEMMISKADDIELENYGWKAEYDVTAGIKETIKEGKIGKQIN